MARSWGKLHCQSQILIEKYEIKISTDGLAILKGGAEAAPCDEVMKRLGSEKKEDDDTEKGQVFPVWFLHEIKYFKLSNASQKIGSLKFT